MLLAFLVVGGWRWAERQAIASSKTIASNVAASHAVLLMSELQKFRLLPLVLGEYSDVVEVLRSGDQASVVRLDQKLELLAKQTNAAAIYVIARDGRTIAASNWRTRGSFVGQNFAFRPYFQESMAHDSAELFASGSLSHRPGFFLARRVHSAAGVIVVKVEFDRIEAAWRRARGVSFVSDYAGVVLITGNPNLRFRRVARPVTPRDPPGIVAQGKPPFRRDDVSIAPPLAHGLGKDFALGTAAVDIGSGRLVHLEPIAAQRAAAQTTARLTVILILAAIIGVCVLIFRSGEKRKLRQAAHRELEAAVAARTTELRAEAEARALLDLRYRRAREELAQANRLAILGQITAGVAHELNQPIAATRVFADNAATFLQRSRLDKVAENLQRIVGLSERMGTITKDLRSFARRALPGTDRIHLGTAIDAARLILADRMQAITLAIEGAVQDDDLFVRGERIRIEQVMINLLQNALDALAGAAEPRISISAIADDMSVRIVVADNGPGIPGEIRPNLFDPFITTKPHGLGIGLSISAAIATESGGELALTESPLGGAAFLLTLKRA